MGWNKGTTLPFPERRRGATGAIMLRTGRAALLAVTLSAAAVVLLVPGISALHAQLLLMAGVVACAFGFGLAPGLAAATLGFSLLLWRSFRLVPGEVAGSAWAPVLDAILWFAVAKLVAALIAVSRHRSEQEASARRAAESEARRREIREEELSHRFNNDMQMLAGLLRSEAALDQHAADALRRAAGRVQIVGRVHRRLLGDGAGTVVDSREFLGELVSDMQAVIDPRRPIALRLEAESHALPARTASDVGLAVNELVTNALKYAFPGNREGAVRVGLSMDREGFLVLSVADNGVGMGRADPQRQGGLGMRLLRALATQLGGRLDIRSGDVGGTVSEIRFPAAGESRPPATPLAHTAEEPEVAPQARIARPGA